jgi:hypothetical protein
MRDLRNVLIGNAVRPDPEFPDARHRHKSSRDRIHESCDYHGIKNFNGIKIVSGITIYNICPDIMLE